MSATTGRLLLARMAQRRAAQVGWQQCCFFSVAPSREPEDPSAAQHNVIVDQYVAAKSMKSSSNNSGGIDNSAMDNIFHPDGNMNRLPNDVHERNALYDEEVTRSMGGVTAQVRHDWTKQEIAEIYQLPFY